MKEKKKTLRGWDGDEGLSMHSSSGVCACVFPSTLSLASKAKQERTAMLSLSYIYNVCVIYIYVCMWAWVLCNYECMYVCKYKRCVQQCVRLLAPSTPHANLCLCVCKVISLSRLSVCFIVIRYYYNHYQSLLFSYLNIYFSNSFSPHQYRGALFFSD